MPRPADRHAKIELLRAAETAFVEHGLAATKVEDITARAGVSKGAFYLHFETKEDCFRQIVEAFLAKLAEHLAVPTGTLPSPGISTSELRDAWLAHDVAVFEFCWQNRAILRMLLEGGGGTPYKYLIDEFAERAAKTCEESLTQAIAAGLYRRDVDPAITAALLSGAYDRLVRTLIREQRRPDIDGWTRQAYDLFTSGLLHREPVAVRKAAVVSIPDRKVKLGTQGRSRQR